MFKSWPDYQALPNSVTSLLRLHRLVTDWYKQNGKGPVTIHCMWVPLVRPESASFHLSLCFVHAWPCVRLFLSGDGFLSMEEESGVVFEKRGTYRSVVFFLIFIKVYKIYGWVLSRAAFFVCFFVFFRNRFVNYHQNWCSKVILMLLPHLYWSECVGVIN